MIADEPAQSSSNLISDSENIQSPVSNPAKRRSRPSTAEEKEDDILPQLKPAPGKYIVLFPVIII